MQRSDIGQAYKDVEKAKAETAKPLSELEERLAKARKLIEPYEREGNTRGF
jgi:hypothetical protein